MLVLTIAIRYIKLCYTKYYILVTIYCTRIYAFNCVNISLSCKGYITPSCYVVVIFLSLCYKTTYECSFYAAVIRYVMLCHIECYITVTINCTKTFRHKTISDCIQILNVVHRFSMLYTDVQFSISVMLILHNTFTLLLLYKLLRFEFVT